MFEPGLGGNKCRMVAPFLTLENAVTDIVFYHEADERAFFEWLARIHCVSDFASEPGHGLVVRLKCHPAQDDLKQLIALFWRYAGDMRQLAKFESDDNRSWFRDREMYWHNAVFGGSAS